MEVRARTQAVKAEEVEEALGLWEETVRPLGEAMEARALLRRSRDLLSPTAEEAVEGPVHLLAVLAVVEREW